MWNFVKVVIFLAVAYFFIRQLQTISWTSWREVPLQRPFLLMFAFLLVVLNWGLELKKWKVILRTNRITVSIKTMIQSLLSGVTTGLITPNRLGNFIGRMVFYKGRVRAQLILGTLYGNFAQFLTSISFGLLGMFLLIDFLDDFRTEILYASLVGVVLMYILYFTFPFYNLFNVFKLKKKQNVITHFQTSSSQLVLPLFIFSGLRYLVFSTQYLFILMAFGATFSPSLMYGIFVLYLISTITPNILFGKIIIRESVALLVLSLFVENEILIIISSLSLWLINLGLPSILGLFYLLQQKIVAYD